MPMIKPRKRAQSKPCSSCGRGIRRAAASAGDRRFCHRCAGGLQLTAGASIVMQHGAAIAQVAAHG